MQHEGSNPMGSLRRRLTEVIVAGLTGVTAAVITSIYGWPGAITGAAFVPMFTTTISAIYTGYVDRAAKMVLTADRPAPPPFDPLADRPPPLLLTLQAEHQDYQSLARCQLLSDGFLWNLLKGGDRFSIVVFDSEWSRPSSAWVSSPRLRLS